MVYSLTCFCGGTGELVQLVCFYYVLTTFTTVGYGKYIYLLKLKLTCTRIRTHICAHAQKTQLLMSTDLGWHQEIYPPAQMEKGCVLLFSIQLFTFPIRKNILFPGVLYCPISLCSFPLWHPGFTGERDCCSTANQVQETGRYT
jgi:hypothetical protein